MGSSYFSTVLTPNYNQILPYAFLSSPAEKIHHHQFPPISLVLNPFSTPLLRQKAMVYYFTSNVVDPPATIYVGKDKFESPLVPPPASSLSPPLARQ